MKNIFITLLLCLVVWRGTGLTARGADCASLTIDALDHGWYDVSGYHYSENENYFCGISGGLAAPPLRNWFAFNIPVLTQQVVSASLRIYTFDLNMTGVSETYELRRVTTPFATLQAGGSGLLDVYNDLGDGVLYGSRTFTIIEGRQFATISLSPAFITNLTAAAGGTLALGGRLVTLSGFTNREVLFASSGRVTGFDSNATTAVQLILNYSNASPLAIVQEPVSQGLVEGDGAAFQVRVCGGGTPSYQWQRSGTNLPGRTNPFLQLLNAVPADSGPYRVLVNSGLTTVTSVVATLTVSNGVAPGGYAYIQYGQSPTLAGSSISLCSTIYGLPTPSRQWQFNGTNLPFRDGVCLGLENAQTNQSGSYRLVASNSAGIFTSAPISLVVTQAAPSGGIYLAYGSTNSFADDAVTFCSTIIAGPTPRLQWQHNGLNLPGRNEPCLSLSEVTANEAGLYRLVASNVVGVFTSAPLALAVRYLAPTGYIEMVAGQSPTPAGSFVEICARIYGAPNPILQWQFNGTDLPGQDFTCFGLSDVSSNEAGLYQLVASNVAGSFTSAPIALVVNYSAPSGYITPSGVLPTALVGSGVSICATIFGAPQPSLQWQFNEEDLPYQQDYCLNLAYVQTNQSGNYRLIASNFLGSFTSAVAVVSVAYAPPTATISLAGGYTPTPVGRALTLCSAVYGAPQPTVQWQFQGTNLPGQINNCLFLSNLQTNQSGAYTIVASNLLGSVTSAVALITVIEPGPVLAYFATGVPPLMIGSYQYLCATVSLPEPATPQWRFNGTNLVGATNFCHYLYPLQPGDAGDYTVVATTASGSYTSPPIALTIYYAPPTQAQPLFVIGSSLALVGEDVSLNAAYAGSPSFIQWRFNGVNLPGQTNGSLALLAVTTNQAGLYSFTASNISGLTTSSVVILNVNYQPPIFALYPSSLSVVEGTTARFQAYAQGGPLPEYFLEFNGTNIAVPLTYEGCCGPATSGFSLLDTTFADAGSYRIIASNFLGMATSIVATLTVTPAGPLDRWTQRNPRPQSQPLFAVAHSTNQFVAVGDRGTILTSPDGANWALQNRRADVALYGAAYGGGLFVAVGAGGTILSSSDGTNWAYRYTANQTAWNAVTYADGRFVVVGTAPGFNTLILHSTDGLHWEKIPIGNFFAQLSVAYGNGRFIAVGTFSIMTSTDGTNWALVLNYNKELESVTYANGLFVATGDDGSILTSTNGTAWQPRVSGTTRRLLGVTYGAGRFVAAGARGTMLTSLDATTWTAVTSGTPDRLEGVDFSNGRFIAVGENGTIVTSTNGTAWTKQNFGVTRDLDGLTVANGLLMVVGKGGNILTSPDGVHYTTQTTGVTNDLHGVTWGGGLWVAVGEPGIVLTSSNAVNWTTNAVGTASSLKGVTYANGQWLAVGTQGTIVRSTDGVTWTTKVTSPAYDLNDVAFGNGVYLVAGDGPNDANGSLFRSFDGVTWMNVNNFYPGKNLRGLTFANGLFLITANDGEFFTTTQGSLFGNSSIPAANYDNLRDAIYAHGLWIVVGNRGTIATSPDLVNWTRRASRTFENQHQIALLDGKLVVIGNRGTVLQSGRFVTELEPPAFLPGTGFRLAFKGVIGRTYQIQASTDLASWTNLLTFINPSEHSEFTDTNALPKRFYRLVEP